MSRILPFRALTLCMLLAVLSLTACDDDGVGNSDPLAGLANTAQPALPAPMQGKWTFDKKRTVEAMQAAAVTEQQKQEAAQTLAMFDQMEKGGVPFFADLLVEDHRITGQGGGVLQPQMDFQKIKITDGTVVGTAYLHEDPNDPGDMSLMDVRLAITDDGLLVLELGPSGEAGSFYFRR